jgi:RNA polymerase sigma factor (sigma-70 family)
MTRVSDERAQWLARYVLPHEAALRVWLRRRRVASFDIDDIVQETYAKLVTLERVDAIRDPRSYTFQVAWSVHVSAVRKANVIPIRAIAQIEQASSASPEASPERVMEDRDELEQLAIALAGLPDKCRAAFLLRRVEGLSHRETAKRLGVSEKTVEKHMARGIRHLMDLFGRGGKRGREPSREQEETKQYRHDSKTAGPRD